MTKQEIMGMLEDARLASFVSFDFRSWLMSNGEKMMIAIRESDKRSLESEGFAVEAAFRCGEQIMEGC